MAEEQTPKRGRGRPRKTPLPSPPPSAFNDAVADKLADALAALAKENSAEARAKEMAKAIDPMNKAHPQISVLNPQGDKDYPRPKLRFRKAFVPWESREDDFTYEECELLNLMEPGEYRIERNDGTTVTIDVKVVKNDITGKEEEIWFLSPFAYSAENRLLMPGFSKQMRQMLGEKAKGILTMAERNQGVAEGRLPVSIGE